jgi:hypothetical protein
MHFTVPKNLRWCAQHLPQLPQTCFDTATKSHNDECAPE